MPAADPYRLTSCGAAMTRDGVPCRLGSLSTGAAGGTAVAGEPRRPVQGGEHADLTYACAAPLSYFSVPHCVAPPLGGSARTGYPCTVLDTLQATGNVGGYYVIRGGSHLAGGSSSTVLVLVPHPPPALATLRGCVGAGVPNGEPTPACACGCLGTVLPLWLLASGGGVLMPALPAWPSLSRPSPSPSSPPPSPPPTDAAMAAAAAAAASRPRLDRRRGVTAVDGGGDPPPPASSSWPPQPFRPADDATPAVAAAATPAGADAADAAAAAGAARGGTGGVASAGPPGR